MGKRKSSKSAKNAKSETKAKKNKEEYEIQEIQEPRPDVYTTMPEQPKKKKAGQLPLKKIEQYFEKGFLVLPDFIEHEVLDEVKKGIEELVDDLAEKLYKAGKIKNKHEDKSLQNRLTYLEKEFPGASVILHKSDILPKSFQKLWSYDKLLNVVEQFIGPEISGNPVWNLRPKTPRNEQLTVPWHQDNAYFEPSGLNTLLVSAWIPLVDAVKENGCMQMVSEGHRKGITATHTCCAGPTWYVDLSEEEMTKSLEVNMKTDVVTCEIPYGGVLLFNNCIPHRSLENFSDSIRWSLDLRWQKPSDEKCSLGEAVVMRTAKNPDLKIDWECAEKSERNRMQDIEVGGKVIDELDPVISGPWMRRWKIVNHNHHTEHAQQTNSAEYKP